MSKRRTKEDNQVPGCVLQELVDLLFINILNGEFGLVAADWGWSWWCIFCLDQNILLKFKVQI
jgi:hypothetical protein